MVYDWSGVRARRIRVFKTSVALILGTVIAAVPLFFWAIQLRDF
ncbi:hypothetical protein GGI59_002211 [Rhizobium lentis]|uniref:Uncharacterized protein n=1 Tax=Rhizobium lentis TaxID=1138194 RepID=A0A7W8UM74_9HYPH|nr:hypothetical protein [Rhizobium lentis]MBB5550424.1 hypothetical protein [Rhizobium lentis]MBB5560549.1 hypothetical protein [Rhizobium lentis]MBB5567134.1 hypothetical protein [Rhizobium lentis]